MSLFTVAEGTPTKALAARLCNFRTNVLLCRSQATLLRRMVRVKQNLHRVHNLHEGARVWKKFKKFINCFIMKGEKISFIIIIIISSNKSKKGAKSCSVKIRFLRQCKSRNSNLLYLDSQRTRLVDGEKAEL